MDNEGELDQFICKFTYYPPPSDIYKLMWSTEFGGANDEMGFGNGAIAISPLNNNIFIVGGTNSDGSSFPTHTLPTTSFNYPSNSGGFDGYIAMFDQTYNLKWSTFLGGTSTDWCAGVDLNNNGDLYISGATSSLSFVNPPGMKFSPCQPYYDDSYNGTGDYDGFIFRFDDGGNSIYRTYLGGSAPDLIHGISCSENVTTGSANIIVTGGTRSKPSQGFPLHNFIPGISYYQPSLNYNGHPHCFITNLLDAASCRIAGNENETKSQDLIIYPNPSNGTLTIKSSGNEISNINIIDILGKTVFIDQNKYLNLYKCDLTHLPNGIYIAEFSLSALIYRDKIIISR